MERKRKTVANAAEITCPFCLQVQGRREALRTAILTEIESWDRRFDGPEAIAEAIVEIVVRHASCCTLPSNDDP